jgi:hypothetical protein
MSITLHPYCIEFNRCLSDDEDCLNLESVEKLRTSAIKQLLAEVNDAGAGALYILVMDPMVRLFGFDQYQLSGLIHIPAEDIHEAASWIQNTLYDAYVGGHFQLVKPIV